MIASAKTWQAGMQFELCIDIESRAEIAGEETNILKAEERRKCFLGSWLHRPMAKRAATEA